MKDAVGKLLRRVGRRGTALLFFGLLSLVYSQGLLFPTKQALVSPTYHYISEIAPLWLWGVIWGLTGLICFIQAFMHFDRLAFSAVMFLMTLFGFVMLGGWWVAGLERGYVSAAIWLAFAAWTGIVATWPEPPPVTRKE